MWFVLYFWRSLLLVSWRRLRRGSRLPAWTWLYEVVVTAQKAFHERVARLPAAAERRAWAALRGSSPALARMKRSEAQFGAVPGAVFEPPNWDGTTTLLYLHGGSFSFGTESSHGELSARLGRAAAARVVFVNYRLAPEHPFPSASDDVLACYRGLVASGVSPADVVAAGDSAGGNLVLALLLALRGAGEAQPRAAVLISPWLDLTARGGSLTANEPFDWASPWMFERWTRHYLGQHEAQDPRASPGLGDLSGLAPLYVTVGGAELLLDQVRAFVDRAERAEVRVIYEEAPDMAHLWLSLAPLIPSFDTQLERMGRFIASGE